MAREYASSPLLHGTLSSRSMRPVMGPAAPLPHEMPQAAKRRSVPKEPCLGYDDPLDQLVKLVRIDLDEPFISGEVRYLAGPHTDLDRVLDGDRAQRFRGQADALPQQQFHAVQSQGF